MGIRKNVLSAVLVSLVLGLAGPVMAERGSESRYDEVIKSKAHLETIRSVGILMLASPHKREVIDAEVARIAWYNHADAGLDEAEMELAASEMRHNLDRVSDIVEKYDARSVALAGVSLVGNIHNLDFYYVADTPHGPVILRATMYFNPAGPPRLFELTVFEGWEECRKIMPSIEHRAGARIVAVSYDDDAEPTEEDTPGVDES